MIPRGLQFVLFVVAIAWAAAANTIALRSAQGIATHFQAFPFEPLMENAFLLFLVIVGFQSLDWIATRGRQASDVLPLPRREGWAGEWAVGSAIGWAMCLAALLPLFLSRHIHAVWTWQTGTPLASLFAPLLSIVTVLIGTLAAEVIFRGYPFRRLSQAIGSFWAVLLFSLGFAAMILQMNSPRNPAQAFINCTLLGLILALAWLRTHALWLGWGLHFTYRVVTAVVLGLPIAGHSEFSSPIVMHVAGPRWFTGGAFGLDAAFLTAIVFIGGMVVLYRVTRDYAWKYTHEPIVAAGYEVTVAPPAAHVAMEKAAAPPPLVQILASTPQTRSVQPPSPPPPPIPPDGL